MNTPYKFLSAKIFLSCFAFTVFALLASCNKDSDNATGTLPDNNYDQSGNGGNDQEGNAFTSVIIGSQEWMNKNLSVATYRDGTPIPQVINSNEWTSLTTGAWCWFLNDSATYAAKYGRLYNWYAVAGIYDAASEAYPALRKQLAPAGWHVPTDAEWTILTDYLGGEDVAGGKMKTTGSTAPFEPLTGEWISPNTGATNSSGFSGVPGGYRVYGGFFNSNFELAGYTGYWWSSSEGGVSSALSRGLYHYGEHVGRFNFSKGYGFSVRCMRN